MKVLFLGDIMGRSGREVVFEKLPLLIAKEKPDFVIANGENAAGGFGLSEKIAKQIFEAGVDCITMGNHVWDKSDIIPLIEKDTRVIRPINYPKGTPGKAFNIFTTPRGKKILVMNASGQLFMEDLDNPFNAIEEVVKTHRLGYHAHFIFLDFHAEATSEKMGMGHMLDGRVTAVVGTHTHIPTADTRILSGGTAYQTDVGMCGDYDSVIGMKKDVPIDRFKRKMRIGRPEVADGTATLCGVLIESDDTTGLATSIRPIRMGAHLDQTEA
ncbi:MAG: TIGR00282 family metallophosphoesterase [Alphaproteobacteria bacterium]